MNVQFNRRVTITELAFYVDIDIDESYTPSKVAIKAGTNFHDLEVRLAAVVGARVHRRAQEIKVTEINGDAKGWVRIPLSVLDGTGLKFACVCRFAASLTAVRSRSEIPLRANLVQLGVLANNENGRDCHVRLTKPVLRARVLTHSLTRADSTD